MSAALRLRQVALVARELAPVAAELEAALGIADPYHDPGISYFGLENSVWAVGDCFLEVVSPVKEGTTAGRYLERRGGDGGYMAIFQTDDIDAARARLANLGVRVVWQQDHDNIGGTHLHPKDVPGAIVSIDWADPPGSWHWAGPAWSGQVPAHTAGGIIDITIEAPDPSELAARWASVLGLDGLDGLDGLGGDGGDGGLGGLGGDGGDGGNDNDNATGSDAAEVPLPSGQRLKFVRCSPEMAPGIVAVGFALAAERRGGRGSVNVAGVRFELHDA